MTDVHQGVDDGVGTAEAIKGTLGVRFRSGHFAT